ncbi:hypothetical protein U1Q18_017521 [Sarracenia purpurea var. burkii]
MASRRTQGRLIIQDENFDLVAGGRSKPPSKNGGTGLGCRKALYDITNKSSLHHEASSRKMNLSKEEFNIEDEMFLHDHKKCIEEQLKRRGPCLLDKVLPGHDSVSHFKDPVSEQTEFGLDSPRCFSLVSIAPSESCPSSPLRWDSPTSSPFAWKLSPPSSPLQWDSPPSPPWAWSAWSPVNFVLKEELSTQSESPPSSPLR